MRIGIEIKMIKKMIIENLYLQPTEVLPVKMQALVTASFLWIVDIIKRIPPSKNKRIPGNVSGDHEPGFRNDLPRGGDWLTPCPSSNPDLAPFSSSVDWNTRDFERD